MKKLTGRQSDKRRHLAFGSNRQIYGQEEFPSILLLFWCSILNDVCLFFFHSHYDVYSASTRYKWLLFSLSPPDTDTLRARDKYTSQILFRVNLTEIYLPSVTSRGDLYASGCRIARQVIVEAASCQPHPHPQYGYVALPCHLHGENGYFRRGSASGELAACAWDSDSHAWQGYCRTDTHTHTNT